MGYGRIKGLKEKSSKELMEKEKESKGVKGANKGVKFE